MAFGATKVETALEERAGRIFGLVTVYGSPAFNKLDNVRRQRALWSQLHSSLGSRVQEIGVIALAPGDDEQPA